MADLKPGWLGRQMDAVEMERPFWPAWLRVHHGLPIALFDELVAEPTGEAVREAEAKEREIRRAGAEDERAHWAKWADAHADFNEALELEPGRTNAAECHQASRFYDALAISLRGDERTMPTNAAHPLVSPKAGGPTCPVCGHPWHGHLRKGDAQPDSPGETIGEKWTEGCYHAASDCGARFSYCACKEVRTTEPAAKIPGGLPAGQTPVPQEVHDKGWQWRPVGDGAFAPPFGTIRVCRSCGCLVAGGPTACGRCANSDAPDAPQKPAGCYEGTTVASHDGYACSRTCTMYAYGAPRIEPTDAPQKAESAPVAGDCENCAGGGWVGILHSACDVCGGTGKQPSPVPPVNAPAKSCDRRPAQEGQSCRQRWPNELGNWCGVCLPNLVDALRASLIKPLPPVSEGAVTLEWLDETYPGGEDINDGLDGLGTRQREWQNADRTRDVIATIPVDGPVQWARWDHDRAVAKHLWLPIDITTRTDVAARMAWLHGEDKPAPNPEGSAAQPDTREGREGLTEAERHFDALIAERRAKGRRTYGRGLTHTDAYDWNQMATEEMLDFGQYMAAENKRLREENERLRAVERTGDGR